MQNYIALDLETTGISPKEDRIIEIGMVKVCAGIIVDTFSTLVAPRLKLDEQIIALTGIDDAMLKNAPYIEDILTDVFDFMEDFPLLGHMVLFDYSFLKKEAVNKDIPFSKQGVDTLKLCRLYMPEDVKKSLDKACAYFDIPIEGKHRAYVDALSSHYLYQKLYALYRYTDVEKFIPKDLYFKIKRAQPASQRQKHHLHNLLNYHRITLVKDIDSLTKAEASRHIDTIISKYGKIREV